MNVEPNFKQNQGPCGCSDETCEAWGTYKRPWRDGSRCVARVCKCRRCQGKANRARGASKQRKATKQLGLSHGQFAGAHEEALTGPVRTEVKATARHAKPVATAYNLMRAQSDAAKASGDTRPFVAAACPPGSSLVYYVVRSDELEAVVFALADAWGFGVAS